MMGANEMWASALAGWAIPEQILAAVPVSPWGLSVDHFAQKADQVVRQPTRSHDRAREALPMGGSVLDVGCGAGAGSLPLLDRVHRLVGVDTSPDMLRAFETKAGASGVSVATVAGAWPDVSAQVGQADVVVCHHVAYNVPDLAPFVLALGEHARRRVVMELTAEHPLCQFNNLWLQFHGIERPARPTIDEAIAVMREVGIAPNWESWESPPGPWFARRQDLVTWVRTRVCLSEDQDEALDAALAGQIVLTDAGRLGFPGRTVATVWWDRAPAPD